VFGDLEPARAAHALWNVVVDWLDDWNALMAKDDATWDQDAQVYRDLLDDFTESVRRATNQKSLTVLTKHALPDRSATQPAVQRDPGT
jgi:hypothetical protein